ncbi:MAG TPA: class I SAM-dependent methyltransferase, partial [Anaerolineales bacterium]|nr:class I SAM-dependent methyltransferase [Anaerolineales bacterium]
MTILYSFPRYLASKKSLDDRALNAHVWNTMTRAVSPATPGEPLRILEVGCGIGTMYARLLERGFPFHPQHPERSKDAEPYQFVYTGIDSSPENIATAQDRFSLPSTEPSSLITHHSSLITPNFLLADLYT